MNALYAAGRRAMTDWVLVNDVAVPSSSYVTEHGRSFLSFSPVIEEEGEVRWMNPRKEPMDAVTANQIVGYLRGYGLIPNLQPNLAMICGWRNESSPKDASRWKDDYNRRREQRGDE